MRTGTFCTRHIVLAQVYILWCTYYIIDYLIVKYLIFTGLNACLMCPLNIQFAELCHVASRPLIVCSEQDHVSFCQAGLFKRHYTNGIQTNM